jgi:hypothetical protein
VRKSPKLRKGDMQEIKEYNRLKELLVELQGEATRDRARLPGDTRRWSRQRAMPLHDILACTLVKKGLRTAMEVRQYFKTTGREYQTISKQGYLQQRQKLNPDVFKILNKNYVRKFYAGTEPALWNGYVVCGVDGSRAEIPNSAENRAVYGTSTARE